MMTRTTLTRLAATLGALVAAGCVPSLQPCDFEGLTGTIGTECALPLSDGDCFMDLDEDGVAARYPSQFCLDGLKLEQGQFGDCDDNDDNNFPGNPEVCDGLDNDCSGVADFAEEDFIDAETGRPRCAAGAEVQVFLRGGGEVSGRPLSARDNSLVLSSGDGLTGEMRLRAFFDIGTVGALSAVAVASWEPPEEYDESNPVILSDPFGGAAADVETDCDCEPCVEHGFCNVTVKSFGGLVVPGAASERPEYLTLAAANDTGGPHLAALSSPTYCCEGADCLAGGSEGPPCDEVYSFHVDFQSDIISDADLRDLTELDLGGCTTFGAARVQELAEAYEGGSWPEGPLERCDVMEDVDCLPLYRPKSIGCQIIPITIADGEDSR